MPPARRLIPRRRRADEGEEEGSTVGDVEDDSLSEGSALSAGEEDGDGEASDASLDDEKETARASQAGSPNVPSKKAVVQGKQSPESKQIPATAPTFTPSADHDAMLNGLKSPTTEDDHEELQFEDAAVDGAQSKVAEQSPDPQINAPKAPRNETPAQRSRREHQEYLRERNTNPAFVPNRGGFFLHDDRSSAASAFSGRPFPRGRGRGFEPSTHGPTLPLSEPTEKQWAHDLHDKHESIETQPPKPSVGPASSQPKPAPTASAPTPPNRTFSFTTVLGNVTVYVTLPGMPERKAVPNVVKKHHTLLPQHRPPLRRDKPVRISIPEEHPRYIFPSTERSFIFIPRALRPNQQSYFRGRGRGSFHGSRRTSVFGGSAYTPSIAMSRKSSFGGVPRDNVRSPTGSTTSRGMMMGMEPTRPIVRLPSAGMMPAPMPMPLMPGTPQAVDPLAQMNGNMMYGFHSTSIPMHQPRPQKTVSVADIESPASLSVKGPQQQLEQPFHQQMPTYVGSGNQHHTPAQAAGPSSASGGTPLSHIPESAIYAQAFQPLPFMQPQMMYGNPYGNPAMFYPPMAQGMNFAAPMPGVPMAPAFAPAMHQGAPQHPQMNQNQQSRTVADESNGMVYYYDPSQFADGGQQQQFTMMPTMMNPQVPYYYPPGANGVYYGAQQT